VTKQGLLTISAGPSGLHGEHTPARLVGLLDRRPTRLQSTWGIPDRDNGSAFAEPTGSSTAGLHTRIKVALVRLTLRPRSAGAVSGHRLTPPAPPLSLFGSKIQAG